MRPPGTPISIDGMRAIIALAAVATAAVLVTGGSAASERTVLLRIGDAVDVAGTKVACFAIESNGKDGVACVLWGKNTARAGTYGVGLAVDGTAVLNRIKADGTSRRIFKRKLQGRERAGKTYRARVGDLFGLQISAARSLGCKVIDVKSRNLAPLYRGVKVSCWRATTRSALPNTYGVTISDKLAGVYRYDGKGRPSKDVVLRRQPD